MARGVDPSGPDDDVRERVLAMVRRHGWNATAFQTLEAGYSYFFHDTETCVAYVDTGAAWVAAGAPIGELETIGEAALAFVAAARSAGRRSCFFAAEERLRGAAADSLHSLRIGEQPVWDPSEWAETLSCHRSLREQLRRARAKGVRVRQTSPEELSGSAIRDGMNQVIERWLATRGMAPMGFLLRVEPFTFPPHRRCFVALVGDRLVGFAGVVPVPARGGWFIEDLVRDPSAPNGTSELLIDAVMQWAHEEGSRWLTLGLAPLAGDVSGWLRLARNTTQPLYDFRGLHRYKAKLRPSSWSPIYLTYPRSQGALTSIFDALVAFTRVGLVRFALRSLLRGPTAVLRPLALLLVPWTVVLAFAPGEPWFGSPWVKWAWVTFDAALVVALLQLLRRPNVRLTVALAIAVTLDALLTAIQAAVWNVPRAEGPLDYAIIAIACLGPLLAAVVLWGAALRLRRLR